MFVSRLILTLAAFAAMGYAVRAVPPGSGPALNMRFWVTAASWLAVFGTFVWFAFQAGEIWGRAGLIIVLLFAARRTASRHGSA